MALLLRKNTKKLDNLVKNILTVSIFTLHIYATDSDISINDIVKNIAINSLIPLTFNEWLINKNAETINAKAIDNSIVACVISKDDTFIIITPLDKHWYINSRIKTKKSKQIVEIYHIKH